MYDNDLNNLSGDEQIPLIHPNHAVFGTAPEDMRSGFQSNNYLAQMPLGSSGLETTLVDDGSINMPSKQSFVPLLNPPMGDLDDNNVFSSVLGVSAKEMTDLFKTINATYSVENFDSRLKLINEMESPTTGTKDKDAYIAAHFISLVGSELGDLLPIIAAHPQEVFNEYKKLAATMPSFALSPYSIPITAAANLSKSDIADFFRGVSAVTYRIFETATSRTDCLTPYALSFMTSTSRIKDYLMPRLAIDSTVSMTRVRAWYEKSQTYKELLSILSKYIVPILSKAKGRGKLLALPIIAANEIVGWMDDSPDDIEEKIDDVAYYLLAPALIFGRALRSDVERLELMKSLVLTSLLDHKETGDPATDAYYGIGDVAMKYYLNMIPEAGGFFSNLIKGVGKLLGGSTIGKFIGKAVSFIAPKVLPFLGAINPLIGIAATLIPKAIGLVSSLTGKKNNDPPPQEQPTAVQGPDQNVAPDIGQLSQALSGLPLNIRNQLISQLSKS